MEFHRPPKVNESDMLSIKKTHDAAIHLVEKNSTDDPKQMKVFFEAALLCYERQSIAAVRVFCQFRGVFVSTRW